MADKKAHISKEIFQRLKQKVEFLNNFSDGELLAFLKLTQREIYQDEEIIFKENTRGDKMYIILSGTVRISKYLGNKQEEVLAKLGEGICFGEMGIIDQSPRSARATVEGGEAILMVVDESLLKNSNIILAYKLYKNFSVMLAGRLRNTNDKLQDLTTQGRQSSSQLKHLVKSKSQGGSSNLQGMNLQGANLSGLFLPGVNMEKSVLTYATLEEAKCKQTVFAKCSFVQAVFDSTVIEEALMVIGDFNSAKFEKTIFSNCNFKDANFTAAEFELSSITED